MFFPPSEILCVYLNFTGSDEGIKHWFNIYLINEN